MDEHRLSQQQAGDVLDSNSENQDQQMILLNILRDQAENKPSNYMCQDMSESEVEAMNTQEAMTSEEREDKILKLCSTLSGAEELLHESLMKLTKAWRDPDTTNSNGNRVKDTNCGIIARALREGDDKCHFLNTIPLEVRNMIYELLLYKKILSTRAVLIHNKTDKQACGIKYELSPALLSTCRQINDEASQFLYGGNTFIARLKDASCDTPIMRYRGIPSDLAGGRWKFHCPVDRFLKSKTFMRVKKWKVIVHVPDDTHHLTPAFVYFCRAWHSNTPRSLKICLMPVSGAFEMQFPRRFRAPLAKWTSGFWVEPVEAISASLTPLSIVRDVSKVSIGADPCGKQYDGINHPNVHKYMRLGTLSQERLEHYKSIIQGSSPANLTFKMHEKLVSYAQAFERHVAFKAAMDPPFHEIYLLHIALTFENLKRQSSNPFIKNGHPVEVALIQASRSTLNDSEEEFLEARTAVLEYLEPQYQRIVAAASAAADYVKGQKKKKGILDPAAEEPDQYEYLYLEEKTDITKVAAEGLLVLEAYAKAFERDMVLEIKRDLRAIRHDLDLFYSTQQIEVSLRQLDRLLAEMNSLRGSPSCGYRAREFFQHFKLAMDGLDDQYLAIRKARKELFVFDSLETGVDIKDIELDITLEPWRCDDKVDWTVREPVSYPD
ncbi:hypothetical protein G7Y89_g12437 [Cudoniella acicularis]|uniref:Uncharacterized protein n=1 Tax=Cudoniella acicularis TaxID=354080 RepID=A0A8H4R937_9HELO|nr:hypothetical protein G7Y89_g12437 [Cudoniella acicularis]